MINFYMANVLIAYLIVAYFLTTYPYYKMAIKANMKNPKYMFIPVVNGVKLFNLAGYSGWYFLIFALISLIPFIGVLISAIFGCVVKYKVCKAFGLRTSVCMLSIFIPIIVFWYIALDDETTYKGLNK